MLRQLKKLKDSRELVMMLAWRDIRIRYKQSVMGLMWAVLMPALIVTAGAMVRIGVARWSNSTLSAADIWSVIVRAVPWAFLVSTIRFGTASLTGNTNLVTKVAFAKEAFPIAAVLSSLLDFAVAVTVVTAVLLFMGWSPTWYALWAIPTMLAMVAFATGMALFLASANLFFRDVKYIVEIFLTYAIFFTPVLYEAKIFGEWQQVILLNPAAPLLESFAASLVWHRTPDLGWLAYGSSLALVTLIGGYWLFKQLEAKFAESI